MTVKRIALAASAAALMTSPAWALPGLAPAAQGKGHTPSTAPSNTSHPGNSHKCKPHKVGYVASGKLISNTLKRNADGTYSGEVTVVVKRSNHPAAGDKGKTKIYKVENVRVTFGLAHTNKDGSVGLDDLKVGDRVKLIGKITALAKKCSQSGFTATTTIGKIVFSRP